MGFFRQPWVKILIVVILVMVVGITVKYLLGARQNQPNAFLQTAPSSQAPTNTRFSPTSVQLSLTPLPTSMDQTITTGWKSYANNKYRLSFDYPSNYTIQGANDLIVTLTDGDKKHAVEVSFYAPGDSQSSTQGQSFSGFAADVAMNESDAVGQGNQEYFDKVLKQIPLQNPYGLSGLKMYFHWIHTYAGKTVHETEVGPVLAYDVSKQTNNVLRAVEIFIGPQDDSESSMDPSILDSIGNSIRFF